jgi:Rieske Fe-S protein
VNEHIPADAPVAPADGPLSRRTMLAAGGVATASAALVAAGCSTHTPSGTNANPASGPAAPAAETAADTQPAKAGGTPLGPAASVPVGGGRVFPQQEVVITQPLPGQFRAFSSVCPHKGCAVNSVSNGTINCPCHNSRFAITDGSVTAGPADTPLEAKQVSTEGGVLRLT